MKDDHMVKHITEMLNKLTREELVIVNKEILRRVKVMDDLNRLKASSAFYPDDRVSWSDRDGYIHIGRVIRINSKTISVREDGDAGTWKISARLLKKLDRER